MTTPPAPVQSPLRAARLIGRVGGLAAALGAGMFLMAQGVASADADSGTVGAESSSHRGAATSTRGTAQTAVDAGPRRGTPGTVRANRTVRSQSQPAAAVVEQRASTVAAAAQAPTAQAPTAAPAAQAPTAAAAAQAGDSLNTITVDPTVTWGGTYKGKEYPGVLVGTLNAYSPLPLNYTVVAEPSLGGKLGAQANKAPSNTLFGKQGEFFYLPDASALTDPTTVETFKILVAQQTSFDDFLTGLPVLGLFMPNLLVTLHQIPIVSDLLAPLIGASQVVTFNVNAYGLATDPLIPTEQRPTAFTTRVRSFDGLMVSTNYFPSEDVALGLAESAPTVLNGPGLGAPGNTDVANPYAQLALFPWIDPPVPLPYQFGSLTPGLPVLREGAWASTDGGPSYDSGAGYNVITWDPRGEFATRDRSLPGLQIDNPFYEGRDASALISWAASTDNPAFTQVQMESAGDPLIGMVGGSYGGGIQWVTAGTDPRVDVIAPEISWNSLMSSLYPNSNQFKTGWGAVLLLALASTGAQINTQIYQGIATGVTLGWLSQSSQATLSSSGPTALLSKLEAPALIFQGMQDGLFPLAEAVANAQAVLANPFGTDVKMVWFCGGHGTCQDPFNPYQDDRGLVDNLRWLDTYLNGTDAADEIPAFQWYDQAGNYHFSDMLPFQPGFNQPDPLTATTAGGLLGIVPVLGGSGPGSVDGLPNILTLGNGTPAANALNLTITPPTGGQVVGAPTLSFDYRGLGTSRTVYAQLIDNATGRVLGNIVTPIPVELDGAEHTVTIPMAEIAYTATTTGASLTLQITSSATNFENWTSFGLIDVSDIRIDLPLRAL